MAPFPIPITSGMAPFPPHALCEAYTCTKNLNMDPLACPLLAEINGSFALRAGGQLS